MKVPPFAKLHPLHKSSYTEVSPEIRLSSHEGHNPERETVLRKDYVEIFFTILYFICILPFKLERKQGSLSLKKNLFQQFCCTLFHATAVLYQVVDVLSETNEAIYKDPEKIFELCFNLIDLLYILWAIKTVWIDQPKFLKLIECLSGTRSQITKNKRRLQIKRFLICLVPLFSTILDIFYILFMEDGPIWKKYIVSSEPLLSAPLFTLLYDKPAPFREIGVVIYFSSVFTNLALYNCLDGFLLALSVSGYEVASYYAKIAKTTRCRIVNGLDTLLLRQSYLIDESVQLKLFFETINDVSSGFFLFWFCSFCPWTALNLIKSLPGFNNWGTVGYNFFYMTYYGIMMSFCVKAKKKVDNYRDFIYETILQQDAFHSTSSNTLNYVDFLLKDTGFAGGHFFILSYRFMGSAIGTVVTYAVLALQFQLTSPTSTQSSTIQPS